VLIVVLLLVTTAIGGVFSVSPLVSLSEASEGGDVGGVTFRGPETLGSVVTGDAVGGTDVRVPV